jgi:tetratricopeptide (TPR) repeat protein
MRHPTALLLCLAATLAPSCRSEDELSGEERERHLEIYTETAQQFLQMGELDRAEGQVQKGLALDPDSVKLRMIYGWTLIRRGRPADVLGAEKLFRDLLDIGDYRATLGLATALERKGVAQSEASVDIRSGKRVTEASDPAARADELVAESIVSWNESVALYEKTLTQRPGDVDAQNGTMRVRALLGESERSLAAADAMIGSLETDLEFWKQRLLRPDISEGEEQRFRKLIRQQTELLVNARLHASSVLWELERPAEAAAHLDAALAVDPERVELLGRRAEVRKSLGRYEEAIEDLRAFLRQTDKPFEHPDVKRAWRLEAECSEALREQRFAQPGAKPGGS